MHDGFVAVAAVTPHVRVADVAYNVRSAEEAVRTAAGTGARVVVLPELCVTAYTCEDLFWQDQLLDAAERGLATLAADLADVDAVVLAGVPLRVNAKLYNCCAVLAHGRILGVVPKRAIPTYNEFYEGRHFSAGPADVCRIDVAGQSGVSFGARQLFRCADMPSLVLGVEVCEDLWVPEPPSIGLACAGATVVCNLSASNDLVGKASYRHELVCGQSARLVCAYLYASAGWGESTQDIVFGGHDLVCENGRVLAESRPFGEGVAASEVDVALLAAERRRMSTYLTSPSAEAAGYVVSDFTLDPVETRLTRFVDPHPFVPDDPASRAERCEDILAIQAHGLARRLQHTGSSRAVVGVSGGLDSTLALLVSARAFDLLGLPRVGILAVTMPGFGTTDRTHGNASSLAEALGCELREVGIAASVRQHFADIGHDEVMHDVTYENAQARERTQILMDLSNQEGGIVVGTGDLSELALGWATYNADHMSMYGVNAGVPKTLVRHLVRHVADTCGDDALATVLADVLATPVSPELLPATADGTISQRTEDLVGPYELHDFFLYGMLRQGFGPAKVYRLARVAFDGTHGARAYPASTILSWEKVFYRRFFAQQFKRSCLPDGPKVGSVAVSPRGDLRMPSDASRAVWQAELDQLV
ncbi:MAG: NAD(+) synthase [Atopobiaceae bacterium]|jgi:NAD+ synthase (glutamine-hydrolysing)|nr:NAD(+) synthase [Atopobiaceae bacterium]MCH4213710.1 NAD(+) synthase [Atopobiaceae bacterium]MCH4275933.1 NAD(+) synthase [Atopobiaceae bacterium]MCI1225690.1 NAD(+) synthase [Atopobiaceae bacterium]MCI1260045.1 NAD(+) synthase [Atopobiaceae bacterium]